MNQQDKHNYLLRFRRFQQNRERQWAPAINKALNAQYKQFTDHVEFEGLAALQRINSASIIKVLRNIYMDAAIVYGAKIRADLKVVSRFQNRTNSNVSKSTPLVNVNRLQSKSRFAMGFSERMAELIAQYFGFDILNQSEGITTTTRELIREVFARYYSEGLSINDIVERLQHSELSRARSRLIARSETVTAANRGGYIIAKETGLNLKKEWISASDNRVRNHHRSVNGQIVGLDDYFNVGGYQMSVPGDRGGKDGRVLTPAKEVANCRCVCLYLGVD